MSEETSKLVLIVQGVLNALSDYHAELSYAPEIALENLSAIRVVVVPMSQTYAPVTRSESNVVYQIQIGVLSRAKEADVPGLLALTEQIALPFQAQTIAGATCTKVEFSPIYSAEYLRQKSLFYSVITLTFEQEVEL